MLMGDCYVLNNLNGTDHYYLLKPLGTIATKKEVEELLENIKSFHETYTDEQIKEHNEKVMSSFETEMRENSKKEKKVKPGFVYFVRFGDSGLKIGYSRRLKSRIKELSTKMPEELKLVGYIKSDEPEKTEKEFHNFLKEYRIKNEWFNVSDDYIKNLCEENDLVLEVDI